MRFGAVLAVLALLTASCTGDDDDPSAQTAPTTPTSTPASRIDDGVLHIGVLLPTTAQQIGEPMIAAARLAINDVNAGGGVNGQRVLITTADEGERTADAIDGIRELLDDGVDAVVGPASSLIALSTLDQLVSAGVLTCSPTATALALDGYPDNGLFFRTAPSDSLQAEALSQMAEATGARTVGIANLDDGYGRPFAEAVATAVRARGLEVSARVGFRADDDTLDGAAASLLLGVPDVVVVLADATEGARMLAAIGDVMPTDPPDILVNDAIRAAGQQVPQIISELPGQVRDQIRGLSLTAEIPGGADPTGAFASLAYDCVMLIALSALQAGSNEAAEIAIQMASVSTDGAVCRTYVTCSELFTQRRLIDYNGPSGVTDLGARGDPTRARFDTFAFDDSGRDITESQAVFADR